jgi:hypothetical protein
MAAGLLFNYDKSPEANSIGQVFRRKSLPMFK